MEIDVLVREAVVGKKLFRKLKEWLEESGREYRREYSIGFSCDSLRFRATLKEIKNLGLWEEDYDVEIFI